MVFVSPFPCVWRELLLYSGVAYRRRKILCDERIRDALRDAIEKTRERYPFEIDAWVLLPDYMHCIWTLPIEDANFSGRWAKIKRFVLVALAYPSAMISPLIINLNLLVQYVVH